MRIPTHLTDSQLIDALARCASHERDATAALVAHLAEMDARRLHLGALEPPAVDKVSVAIVHSPSTAPPAPVVTPLAADRYQIRFTASAATRDKLRVAQDLLRHSVPDGDPAEIIDRALTALIERLAKEKCAAVSKPAPVVRPAVPGSRHIPAIVRRAVWTRDEGRCAFVAASGRRCRERGFLEFHHVRPFAVGGGATVANIQLRCGAHNGHEARLVFRADVTGPGASWG